MAEAENQAVDMRHTKLKPEEAALIAGELVKPSWASRNEGIHERVSFEDTLWGFELAGGAYYKTPLRVVYVKPGSRAEQACIKMGDTVLRIQGIDTSTLTLQEAHQIVHEAGINLQIVVTSPDDEYDAHYVYQDPLMEGGGLTAEQLAALERERVQRAIAKAIRCRDIEWPWVRRKFIIYRESNCFMVPSKYENKHREQFPELPAQRVDYFFAKPPEKIKPIKKQNVNPTPEVKEPEQNGVDYLPKEKDASNGKALEETKEEENVQEEGLQEERLQQEIDNKESDTEIENENGLDEIDEDVNTIRKDSEGSSVIELDNNNNHVSKKKNVTELVDDERNIENNAEDDVDNPDNSSEKVENNSEDAEYNSENVEDISENVEQSTENLEDHAEVDEFINELAEDDNESSARDPVKSDDEIIDSVLSGDEDTINER